MYLWGTERDIPFGVPQVQAQANDIYAKESEPDMKRKVSMRINGMTLAEGHVYDKLDLDSTMSIRLDPNEYALRNNLLGSSTVINMVIHPHNPERPQDGSGIMLGRDSTERKDWITREVALPPDAWGVIDGLANEHAENDWNHVLEVCAKWGALHVVLSMEAGDDLLCT